MEYQVETGRPLDLVTPVDIAAKLMWLKLFDRNPFYPTLVDKVAVRQVVEARANVDLLIDLYGVWTNPDEIDPGTLPRHFVLKASHGWNLGRYVDQESDDWGEVIATARRWLGVRHELRHGEWAYSQVEPRLLAERRLEAMDDGPAPADYKFFCFGGEPVFLKCDVGRFGETGSQAYLSLGWDPMPFRNPNHPGPSRLPPRPDSLDEMIEVARLLSANLPFARIDLYDERSRGPVWRGHPLSVWRKSTIRTVELE